MTDVDFKENENLFSLKWFLVLKAFQDNYKGKDPGSSVNSLSISCTWIIALLAFIPRDLCISLGSWATQKAIKSLQAFPIWIIEITSKTWLFIGALNDVWSQIFSIIACSWDNDISSIACSLNRAHSTFWVLGRNTNTIVSSLALLTHRTIRILFSTNALSYVNKKFYWLCYERFLYSVFRETIKEKLEIAEWTLLCNNFDFV